MTILPGDSWDVNWPEDVPEINRLRAENEQLRTALEDTSHRALLLDLLNCTEAYLQATTFGIAQERKRLLEAVIKDIWVKIKVKK